jgi:hypothetical protein
MCLVACSSHYGDKPFSYSKPSDAQLGTYLGSASLPNMEQRVPSEPEWLGLNGAENDLIWGGQFAQDICPKHFLPAGRFLFSIPRRLGQRSSAYFCSRLPSLPDVPPEFYQGWEKQA